MTKGARRVADVVLDGRTDADDRPWSRSAELEILKGGSPEHPSPASQTAEEAASPPLPPPSEPPNLSETIIQQNLAMTAEHAVCNLEDSPFYVFRACARGLLETVEKLLEEDPTRSVSADTKGWTCVHHAASRDKLAVIDLLLKYSKATLNAPNVDGDTPLHLAAQNGKKNAVHHLLEVGANPNILNKKKFAPIHLATIGNHPLVVKELVSNEHTDVDIKTKNGSSSIHIAAMQDLEAVSKELVAAGCELCGPNLNGFFPIHLAAKNASEKALEIILMAAETNGISREMMFSYLDAENNSPLHSAVNGGHVAAVRVCLVNGARVEAKADDGATPFHLACNQGSPEVVKLMLDSFRLAHGEADSLLGAVDSCGLTPLHRAALFDHPDIVALLLGEGAVIEAKDNDGRTPLLITAMKGGGRSLRILLEAGASVSVRDANARNVFHFLVAHGQGMTTELALIYESAKGKNLLNQQDAQGCTPLHSATRQGNLAFIDSLLRLGATVSTKNNEDQSALHFAARYGRVNTVRRLLDYSGTIINETDSLGMTPLHVASINGHTKVLTLLLQRGALIHKDFQGQTPLHLAAEKNYTRSMKLLLSYHRNLLDQTDKRRNTALHLAAVGDKAEAVELLLSMDAAYTGNGESKTPLDLCIQAHCSQAALAIVHHDRWNEFLSLGSAVYGSPLLGLIQFLPHVHRAVLDRCLSTSKAHPASKHYWEKFEFRHMEPEAGTARKLTAISKRQSNAGDGGSHSRFRTSLLCLNVPHNSHMSLVL